MNELHIELEEYNRVLEGKKVTLPVSAEHAHAMTLVAKIYLDSNKD
jgi:hypothetical protein